jgi:NADPH-dependent 2,4-dienoyl-CoA reductase/sulfur reductase-like enzyme
VDSIVIVGAALAGLRAATMLRSSGFTGSLTLVGDEPHMPYDRPPLSKEVLRGDWGADEVVLPGADALDATWRLGVAAERVDAAAQQVVLADGDRIGYDGLLLATGSGARGLAPFDTGAANVHVVRTVADATALRETLAPGVRLLVVGCGFVGIEVASSASSLGAEVTVIGLDPPVFPAGPLATATATRLIQDAGIDLRVPLTVTELAAHGARSVATFSDGSRDEVDQIVVAVGSVPHTGWLAGSGAELDRGGVVADASLRVAGLTNTVVAGDIAQWPNPAFAGMPMRVEHWSNAVESGVAAARTLVALAAGDEPPAYSSMPSFWSDHFGIRLQSVGLPRLADRFEVTAGSTEEGVFCAEAYAGDVLVAGVTYGMVRQLLPIKMRLTREGVAIPTQ